MFLLLRKEHIFLPCTLSSKIYSPFSPYLTAAFNNFILKGNAIFCQGFRSVESTKGRDMPEYNFLQFLHLKRKSYSSFPLFVIGFTPFYTKLSCFQGYEATFRDLWSKKDSRHTHLYFCCCFLLLPLANKVSSMDKISLMLISK